MPSFDPSAARGRLRSSATAARGGRPGAAAKQPTDDVGEPATQAAAPTPAGGAVRVVPMGFNPAAVKLRSATAPQPATTTSATAAKGTYRS